MTYKLLLALAMSAIVLVGCKDSKPEVAESKPEVAESKPEVEYFTLLQKLRRRSSQSVHIYPETPEPGR
jgi:hypothetical protein